MGFCSRLGESPNTWKHFGPAPTQVLNSVISDLLRQETATWGGLDLGTVTARSLRLGCPPTMRCGVILRVGVQFSWSKKQCIPPSLAVHVFGWRIVHHRVMVCVMRVYLHVS